MLQRMFIASVRQRDLMGDIPRQKIGGLVRRPTATERIRQIHPRTWRHTHTKKTTTNNKWVDRSPSPHHPNTFADSSYSTTRRPRAWATLSVWPPPTHSTPCHRPRCPPQTTRETGPRPCPAPSIRNTRHNRPPGPGKDVPGDGGNSGNTPTPRFRAPTASTIGDVFWTCTAQRHPHESTK